MINVNWEQPPAVAPFAGAWIEIENTFMPVSVIPDVAPFAGAWIEIELKKLYERLQIESHPSRVRGLKFNLKVSNVRGWYIVAPFAGAWIEICC